MPSPFPSSTLMSVVTELATIRSSFSIVAQVGRYDLSSKTFRNMSFVRDRS